MSFKFGQTTIDKNLSDYIQNENYFFETFVNIFEKRREKREDEEKKNVLSLFETEVNDL